MNTNQPILSCAGREAVSIDAAILKELLLSFKPTTIGIRQKAEQLATHLLLIANDYYPNDALEVFKGIITEEFLYLQLTEAGKLARQVSAEPVCQGLPEAL